MEIRPTHGARSAMIRIGADCVFYCGALGLLGPRGANRETASPMPFSVLIYHRVNSQGDAFFPSLSVSAFEAQMRYLARQFRVLPLREILRRVRAGKAVEPWTVAITFDDGYRDNFLYAHPILKKYGLRASLFVPTSYIDSGRLLWNDRLAWALKHTERKEVGLSDVSAKILLPLRSNAEKQRSFLRLVTFLKARPDEHKEAALESLVKELGCGSRTPGALMLNWKELREMAEQGWEIGSHTVNHSILTRVPLSLARHEVCASKAIIEEQLQQPAALIAYPNGKGEDFNAEVKALVREAGYEGAVTTVDGFNGWPLDPLELKRRNPWEEHLPSFATKMKWSYWKAMNSAHSPPGMGRFLGEES
ncbi:MAG: polysaccharide deacetylase family protein [Candidatus Binatia bacterium]